MKKGENLKEEEVFEKSNRITRILQKNDIKEGGRTEESKEQV